MTYILPLFIINQKIISVRHEIPENPLTYPTNPDHNIVLNPRPSVPKASNELNPRRVDPYRLLLILDLCIYINCTLPVCGRVLGAHCGLYVH